MLTNVVVLYPDGRQEHTMMDIPEPEPEPEPETTADELMDILLGVENDG